MKRAGWLLVAALVLGLAWWALRDEPTPTRARPVPIAPGARHDRPHHAPAPDEASPATPESARARGLVAGALGLEWVDCPRSPAAFVDSLGPRDQLYEERSDGVAFSTPHAAGAVPTRAYTTNGDTIELGEVTSVLVWTTGPDGVTTCEEEPPRRGVATVRAVDEQGAPLEVFLDVYPSSGSHRTGPDGVAEIEVFNGGPVDVTVAPTLSPEWHGTPLVLYPGDEVDWPLVSTRLGSWKDGLVLTRRAMLDDTIDHLDAVRSVLDDPEIDDVSRGELRRLDGMFSSLVEHRSAWFDADGNAVLEDE